MAHEVKLEQFEGPLDLLLKLIEQEKLEITEIALSRVTESYLKYLTGNKGIAEEEMADFLVIATRLLYLKSKALLPGGKEASEEGVGLEEQLKMYKEFLEATKGVERILKKKKFAYFREAFWGSEDWGFRAPKGASAVRLKRVFEEILAGLKPLLELPQMALEKTCTIKEKIEEILKFLAESGHCRFRQMMEETRSRTELIVSFLALLELTKQQHIVISQEKNFEEIAISASEL